MACAGGGCWWISRLNVSRLSQTVEGLELVFGERLGGRGVDGGGGGVDRLPHHVQGRKGIERCCGGSRRRVGGLGGRGWPRHGAARARRIRCLCVASTPSQGSARRRHRRRTRCSRTRRTSAHGSDRLRPAGSAPRPASADPPDRVPGPRPGQARWCAARAPRHQKLHTHRGLTWAQNCIQL